MVSPRGSLPRQADEEGEGHGEQEVEDAQPVQLLPDCVLPALVQRGLSLSTVPAAPRPPAGGVSVAQEPCPEFGMIAKLKPRFRG